MSTMPCEECGSVLQLMPRGGAAGDGIWLKDGRWLCIPCIEKEYADEEGQNTTDERRR